MFSGCSLCSFTCSQIFCWKLRFYSLGTCRMYMTDMIFCMIYEMTLDKCLNSHGRVFVFFQSLLIYQHVWAFAILKISFLPRCTTRHLSLSPQLLWHVAELDMHLSISHADPFPENAKRCTRTRKWGTWRLLRDR